MTRPETVVMKKGPTMSAKELLEGTTPGEWLQAHRETKVSDGMHSTEIYTEDGGSGRGVIATLSWYPKPADARGAIGTYREANARLIAAAPRLARENITLTEQVEALREALMPFAATDMPIEGFTDEMRFSFDALTGREVTIGQVRAARTALASTSKEPTDA